MQPLALSFSYLLQNGDDFILFQHLAVGYHLTVYHQSRRGHHTVSGDLFIIPASFFSLSTDCIASGVQLPPQQQVCVSSFFFPNPKIDMIIVLLNYKISP